LGNIIPPEIAFRRRLHSAAEPQPKTTYQGGAETRRKQKQKLKSKKTTQKNFRGRGELKKESGLLRFKEKFLRGMARI